MSETNSQLQAEELEALKARADLLGVKYHPSISYAKLAEKIKEHQADAPAGGDGDSEDAAPVKETEHQKLIRIRADAERLVRIRVTCLNPAKKDWPGEIITVGNRAVGTLKKFVPFNADEGWHVPHMIYQAMKARECQIFVTTKERNGVAVRKGKLIREFAIEVLPQLTEGELAELARRQAMEAGQTV